MAKTGILWLQRNKLLVGVLAACLLTFGLSGLQASKASAADCSNNSIIYCGESTPSAFVSQVRINDSKNGHHDLQAIYAHYGLEPASYDRFVTSAKSGTAYKDGRIVVDGQIVATNAKSIGRQASSQGSGYFTQSIPGSGTYYGNTNDKAFASDSIPVMVLFNSQGVMQFAVLTSCSNPAYGSNIVPKYSCNLLHKSAVSGKLNTYSFTTSASAANNASVQKLVYDFGDGTSATANSPSTPVQHTYTKAGKFIAKVTVYVKLPGNQTVTVTSADCATTITVLAPYFSCVQLAGAILDKARYKYSFTATANYGNGASFKSADFDFGDKTSVKNVNPSGTSVTTTHTYAAPGNYTAIATLHFDVNGSIKNVACQASLTPTQPPTPECRPGVPQGSALCSQCQSNASIPASDVNCVAPAATTLPNTGAGQVVLLFTIAAVGGFLLYRQYIIRQHVLAGIEAGYYPTHPIATHHKPVDDNPHPHHHGPSKTLHHPTYPQPHRFRPRTLREQ